MVLKHGMTKSVGTLRNYDGDGEENVKKAGGLISKTTTLHVHHAFLYISLPLQSKTIDLDWQNNNSARASRFFVHFFAVLAQLRRFFLGRERVRQGDKFYHLCMISGAAPSLQFPT